MLIQFFFYFIYIWSYVNLRLSPLNNTQKIQLILELKYLLVFLSLRFFCDANLIESAKHPPPATTIIVPSLFIF